MQRNPRPEKEDLLYLINIELLKIELGSIERCRHSYLGG